LIEVLWRGKRDLAAAERAAKDAISSFRGTQAEAQARLFLAWISLDQKRPGQALEQIDELLRLRATVIQGMNAEAYYLKGRALADFGQWEDASPRFKSVTDVDHEGSWALLGRFAMLEGMRNRGVSHGVSDMAREAVEIARKIPSPEAPRNPPFGWGGFWWDPVEVDRWKRCARSLREIARLYPESDFAQAALHEAERIERERTSQDTTSERRNEQRTG
jgi:hypothetical protein